MLSKQLKQKAYKERRIEWEGEKGWFYLFNQIDPIAALWSNIPKQRIYLQVPYLRVMENSGLKDVQPYYGLWVDEKGTLCAVIYCQIVDFKADKSIKWSDEQEQGKLQKLRTHLKKKLASQLRFTTLVVGNLSMSGPFGQWIESDRSDQRADIIMQMSTWAYELLTPENEELKAILLKDYFQPLHAENPNDFAQFEIQPAMELNMRKSWSSFPDYVHDLRSKYRVRYRKARERLNGISKVIRKGNEMESESLQKVYQLYLKRAEYSDFNIATLEKDYFSALSKELGDKVFFQLYYHEDILRGFMCMVDDGTTLDAQFTGYEEEFNIQHDIYLNLLYDVIAAAIELKVERISFARTAMEIKSSVGAHPRDLYCYLFYQSAMGKIIVPSIVKYLEPKVNWNQRHPFKEASSS